MDDAQNVTLPTCARCQLAFTWDEAYQHQDTPGSAPYNPPGHGVFRPRAYCPNCGVLVAEWHIDQTRDYDEWAWFGENAAVNAGKPLPPNPLLMWGKAIPVAFLPTYPEHQLAIDKIKGQEGGVQPKEPESSQESDRFVQQGYQLLHKGDFEKASQLFEQAAAAGLNRHDYACALGSTGLFYLWKRQDVEQAILYSRRGVECDTGAYWQMHYVLSLIYDAAGEPDNAQKELADAHRYAGARWWEEDFERELKSNLRLWLDQHGEEPLKAIMLSNGNASLGANPGQGTKKCPRCAEEIKLEAKYCRFCGARFEITESGYCPVCHRIVEPDSNGKCPVCYSDILDRHVTSKFIEEIPSPSQASGAQIADSALPPPSAIPSAKPLRWWQLYFSPNGRIGRATFFLKGILPLFGVLCLIIAIIALANGAEGAPESGQAFLDRWMGAYILFILVFSWIWLMLFVKRFHDLNRSGWNILLWILPLIGQFIYLINIIECFFMKGVEPNRFSNDPNQAPNVLPVSPGARRGRIVTQLALVIMGVAMIFVVYYLLTDRVMFLPAISRAATRVAGSVQLEVATAGPLASTKSTQPPRPLASTRTPTSQPYSGALALPGEAACFVGSSGDLVCLGHQGWQTDFGADMPFGDSNVNGMAACPDGSALFMTSDGILGFDGSRWKEYPSTEVSSPVEFACDAGGHVWISGYSGVARLDGEAWTEFPIEQILDTSDVTERPKGIALSPDGTLWLALDHSLARYKDETWTFYRKGQGFNQEFTFVDVVIDSNSKAWAAYQNGLLTQQGDGWKQISLSNLYKINTLAIDDQDRIWAGAAKNLWVYYKGMWMSHNMAQGGKSDENVMAVAVDDQGRVWAGTHWGLNVVDEAGKVTTYHMNTSELKDNRIDQVIVLGGGPPLPDLAEEPPGTIRGKFTAAGQPLGKARIEVCMSSLGLFFTGATPCTGEPGFKSTTTDENGEFLLEDLPEGYYSVTARKPDGHWTVYSCKLCVGSRSVLVSSGQTAVLDTLEIK